MESASEHCVFDIVLLLVLHSCGFKKPVESLFRSKILSSHFTEVLLESAFKSSGDVSSFDCDNWETSALRLKIKTVSLYQVVVRVLLCSTIIFGYEE